MLGIMNCLLRCLHDLATKLIVGKIMYKFDKQCKFYILGQGNPYVFIYFVYLLFFTLLLNYMHGCHCIWDFKFEEYCEECDQLRDTHVIIHTTLILI